MVCRDTNGDIVFICISLHLYNKGILKKSQVLLNTSNGLYSYHQTIEICNLQSVNAIGINLFPLENIWQ